MKLLQSFFKQKETLLGISAAIAFQVIFVFVWLTAYDGVYDRTDQFTVGIINDDAEFGEAITKELEHGNLFEIEMFTDLKGAKQELDDRNISMLIHFPEKVTEQLQANEHASIDYYINQSTPTLTKQMMEKIANGINGQINEQAQDALNAQIAEKIPQTVAAQSEHKDIVEQVASQVVEIVQENSHTSPVQENVIKTNDKEGFAATMVPLLIVLASYIGAMLVS